jgi:hypothetical protein
MLLRWRIASETVSMMPTFLGQMNQTFYLHLEWEVHSATIYLKSQPLLCKHSDPGVVSLDRSCYALGRTVIVERFGLLLLIFEFCDDKSARSSELVT